MDLTSKTEEKILCVWAKIILAVGIIEAICVFIVGIYFAINEESFLYFILSIIVAALLSVPFILMWAMVRVIAKMSLNLSDTNFTIYRLTTIVETNFKKKTESMQRIEVSSTSSNTTKTSTKQATQDAKQEKKNVPLASVLIIMDEINKKGGSEADKLCRLMEMRDDGTISDEIYDAVLQKIN